MANLNLNKVILGGRMTADPELTSSLMSMVIEGESEEGDTKFLYLALPMKMRDN